MSWCASSSPEPLHIQKGHKVVSALAPVLNCIVLSYLCLAEYFWFEARLVLMKYFHGVTWQQWIKSSHPPYDTSYQGYLPLGYVFDWKWNKSQLQAWCKSFEFNPKLVLWSKDYRRDLPTIAAAILSRWKLEKSLSEAYFMSTDKENGFNQLQLQNWSFRERILYNFYYNHNENEIIHKCLSNNMEGEYCVVSTRYQPKKLITVVNPLTMPLMSAIICVTSLTKPTFHPATIISFDD